MRTNKQLRPGQRGDDRPIRKALRRFFTAVDNALQAARVAQEARRELDKVAKKPPGGER